ncbi:MAG: S4 domain-containing protein, partial [Saprospiraceae bacterium]
MEKTRIDKYLWSIRIFKSRSMATDACREGKIKLNGAVAKSSAIVTTGDLLDINKDNFRFKYKVVQVIEKRVSAILAKPCYE